MASSSSPSLARRAAVVTGSSSGIGRAIALALAEAGADVLVHARASQEAAEQTATEIRQHGGAAQVVLADVADPTACEQLVEEAWKWRPIDIWINNAGADVLTGPAADWPFEQKLAQLWQVDVQGTIRLSRLAGARMKAQGRGTILNIGWDQAAHGMAGDSGEMFAATKAAVEAFSRSLAKSLAPEVRVNCVAPGWIKTAWGEQASDYWQTRATQETLLGRWGEPADVAGVCRFLASDEASFLTGQTLNVNGGFRGSK